MRIRECPSQGSPLRPPSSAPNRELTTTPLLTLIWDLPALALGRSDGSVFLPEAKAGPSFPRRHGHPLPGGQTKAPRPRAQRP